MPGQSYQEAPITFEKGLVKSIEDSVVDPGMAADLMNWVPQATGGLRARNKWRSIPTSGLPSTRSARGFSVVGRAATPSVLRYATNATTAGSTVISAQVNATAGNMLIASVANCLDNTPSGWTKVIRSTQTGNLAVYAKTAIGGSESVQFTTMSGGGSLVLYEATNCGMPTTSDSKQDSNLTTNPKVISLTGSQSSGLGISVYLNATQPGAFGGSTFTKVFSYDSTSANTTHSYLVTTSSCQDSKNAPAAGDDVYMVLAFFPGTNLTQRVFDVLYALATSDHNALSFTVTKVTNGSSTTDATTYTTASVAPSAAGNFALFVVSNKSATADAPTSVTGTNGWGGTWTQVATVAASSIRLTVYRSKTVSTTAGTVTVNFPATQGTAAWGILELTAPSEYVPTESEVIVQTATGSGSGTSVSLSLANFAKTSNSTLLFTADTSTAGGGWTAESGWTNPLDTGSTEGLTAAAFKTKDSDETPSATHASLPWVAIAAEVNTTASPNGYRLYTMPFDELVSGSGSSWTFFGKQNAPDNSQLCAMAQGGGYVLISSPSMPAARLINISSKTTTDITTTVEPGRTVAFHKNRFFIGGSSLNPSRLFFSDLANPTSWPANNYIDINGDDGEAIEDIVSVENLLLILKTTSAWVLSGSGIESFFLTRLPGGGAIAGRSATITPYGTIAAAKEKVWNIQGGGADIISRPLGADGYSSVGPVSGGLSGDKVFILDGSSKTMWAYDMTSGSWHQEKTGDTGDDNKPYVMWGYRDYLFWGPKESTTTAGGFRSLAKDQGTDETGAPVGSSAKTGKLALFGPGVRYTPRHLFYQVRCGSGTPQPITVNVYYRGGTATFTYTPSADTVARVREDIGAIKGTDWIQIEFSYPSNTTGAAPVDIEKVTLGMDIERWR